MRVIGCDLGGSKLHMALADGVGTILAERHEATAHDALLAQIARLGRELAAVSGGEALRAVFGIPGVMDPATGQIGLNPNIPALSGIDVRAALAEALGCPVAIHNDVNLAALAESRHGSHAGCRDLVFVALGTGIGMGIISAGRLLTGAKGAAAEIAYLPIGGDPFAPANVAQGTFEARVGAAGIAAAYAKASGRAAAGVPDLFAAAAGGDGTAQRVLTETAALVAQGLCAAATLLDPAQIVLGGGIGSRIDLLDPVRDALHRVMPAPPPVSISVLGPRASLIGAIDAAVEMT